MGRRGGIVCSLVLVVFAVSVPIAANAATVDWVDQFGTEGYDFGYGVSVDAAGNSYVTGTTDGALPGQRSRGEYDALLRAYDSLGQQLFTRQFGTRRTDSGIQTTVDGTGVYVLGNTSGRLRGQESAGGSDAFIRKYDMTGQHLWTLQFGTRQFDTALSVEDHVGVLYVVGTTDGKFKGETNFGHGDAFVAAISTDGDLQWARQFGTRGLDVAYANAVDATGIYTIGSTKGRFPGGVRAGRQDVVAMRLDLNGGIVWTSQFGSSRFDDGQRIDLEGAGLYLGGQTTGRITDEGKSGEADAWLRRVEKSDGKEVWTDQFGGSKRDAVSAIVADGGFLHVVGITESRLGGQARIGESDGFVRSSDLDGANPSTTLFGTRRFDYPIWADGDAGQVVALGVTYGRFGAQRFGNSDVFVIGLSVL